MKFHLSVVLLFAATAAAQTPCQADFDGSIFKNNVSMGGPNFTNCIKTTAKTNLLVLAVQVWTGEKIGTSTVGIWAHDSVKDEPKSELARGSWSMKLKNGWQGANLSKPVILTKGQTFWVSWIPVAGSQASVQNSGTTLPGIQTYKWSKTNSAPWNGPYKGHQWKFRLWCQKLAGGIARIGNGCADGFGAVGIYATNLTPTVGNASFKVEGTRLPPSAAALVVIGLQKTFPSVDLSAAGAPGCFLHSDLILQLGMKTTAGTPSKSDGTLSVPMGIPNNAALKGFFLRTQLFVADAASRRNLKAIFTNGLGITIQ